MEEQIGQRVRARIKDVLPGATQVELAQQLSLTPDAFSRALNGKRAFTAVELVELAHLLQTSAHWFVTGEEDPFTIRYAGRHTFNHETKTHEPIDWDDEHRSLADVALAYLQAYGDAPAVTTAVRPLSAKQTRLALRNAGGDDFVRRLADLVESEFGVDVVRIPGIIRGYALEVLGRQVIVIGETGSWFFENWSIAHELAHVMRGELSERGDSACDNPAAEVGANRFAADVLMPKELVDSIPWASADEAQVAQFLWDTGVSVPALKARLKTLGVVVAPALAPLWELKTQAVVATLFPRGGGVGDLIAERMQAAAARRFPAHLVAIHRVRVAEGTLLVDMLAWMLGVDRDILANELEPPIQPLDIDWLAEQLGFSGSDGD